MKFTYALIVGSLFAALSARAVYAPIPEQQQGKNLTVSVRTGLGYDSNIFGGATDEISSSVWELSPRITYNTSLTDQTFLSASYGLTLNQFENRPGDKLLDSHDLTLRVAHAFTSSRVLDVSETFMIARNPESLLNGVPLNADQSFKRNQIDGRFETSITPKIGAQVKARSVVQRYRNAVLGRSLDHTENLYGIAGDFAILPEAKGVVEFRHLDVFYRKEGDELKNKSSDYVMAGMDYEVAKKLMVSSRVGAEWRRRAAAENTTSPYVELSGKYDYAEQSFLTGGYAYTFDESSDTVRFTDQKVRRMFVNVQHSISALVVGSVSVNYEPAVLQGRLGQPNLDETTTRVGGALSYLPTRNWIVSVSYDFDRVQSDDQVRSVKRRRFGVSAAYTF